jgi:phage/plasmid primase, P4 family, C-terminal domain
MAKIKTNNYLDTPVSLYKAVTNRKGSTVYIANGSKLLREVLQSPDTDRLVKAFRKTNDKKMKARINTFTPVGKYGSERKKTIKPEACTNLVQIDIDSKVNGHVKNWTKYRDYLFKKYEWIAVIGLSCSGAGLFIFANTTAYENYEAHFNHIANLLNEQEELNIDLAVSSPNELRYCTLSEDVVFREKAKVYKGMKEREVHYTDTIEVKGDGEIIPVPKETYGTWHYVHLSSYLGKSIANAVPKEAVIEYMQGNCKKFFDKASTRFGDPNLIREQIETFYENYEGEQFGSAKRQVRAKMTVGVFKPEDFDGDELDFHKTNAPQRQIMIIDAILDKHKIITTPAGVHFYTGTHWQLQEDTTVEHFLMSAAQAIGADPGEVRHYKFSEELLAQLKKLTRTPFQTAANKLNLVNGTYDTVTGKLNPHSENDYLFYALPYELDTQAKSPLFDKYLETVLPSKAVQQVIFRYVASCFSNVKLEKMLCLHGYGANGKSVLMDILRGVLGDDNCTYVPLDSLAGDNLRGANSRTLLNNKLINFSYEARMQKLDFNMFKMLASREPVEARFMYGNPFFMTNYARTIYSINQLPTHVESTAGFFRRLLIIPFKVTIDKNKQDKRLAEKIVKQEAPGVLNYILTAMKAFNKNESLAIPEELERIIEDLETETDNVKQWMDENGYTADNKTPKVKLPTLKDLYFEYKDYCESAGIPGILGRTTFLRRLEKYGIKSIKAGRGLENVRRLNLGKCAV